MTRATLLSLSLLAIASSGCGGDDSPGEPDAGPLYRGEDLCLGATDQEVLSWRTLDAGAPDPWALDIAEVAKDCVRYSCLDTVLAGGDVEGCMQACLDASMIGAASADCQGCFIDAVFCAQDHCVFECLGSDFAACDACVEAYCVDGLDLCTGLPSPI